MKRSSSQLSLAKLSALRMYFHHWALKWQYGNTREDVPRKPDLPTIIVLLQAVGFKLRELKKKVDRSGAEEPAGGEEPAGSVKITVECGSSRMAAVLDMSDVSCACQDNVDPNTGSFWSITGTGPMADSSHQNQVVEETGSSLLPDMSKESMQAIQDVLYRVVKVIDAKGEVDTNEFKVAAVGGAARHRRQSISTLQNPDNDAKGGGLLRSNTDFYKQPGVNDTNPSEAHARRRRQSMGAECAREVHQPRLQRQSTYELQTSAGGEEVAEEPRPQVNRVSNSPMRRLAEDSFGQVTVQSNDGDADLADCVLKAHGILGSAVELLKDKIPANSTFGQDELFNRTRSSCSLTGNNCISPAPSSSDSFTSGRGIPSSSSSGLASSLLPKKPQQRSIPRPTVRIPSTGVSRGPSSTPGLWPRASLAQRRTVPGKTMAPPLPPLGRRVKDHTEAPGTPGMVQGSRATGAKVPVASKLARLASPVQLADRVGLPRENKSQVGNPRLGRRTLSVTAGASSASSNGAGRASFIKPPSGRFNGSGVSSTSNVSKPGFAALRK
ncbi:uncharacterized protein LOC106644725 [Copidosoma floridanum]|uniref:uncharacterized protein LOC106644725 n=1 Tax=Copidosoma floridanum TaxID=29053 RepID=UPI0006C963B1|nr:uncharacterized protein LOC106644725 [Copidosoma floridanum]